MGVPSKKPFSALVFGVTPKAPSAPNLGQLTGFSLKPTGCTLRPGLWGFKASARDPIWLFPLDVDLAPEAIAKSPV